MSPMGATLTDRAVVGVAAAIGCGCWWHPEVGLPAAVALVAVALVVRHPVGLAAAGFVLAAALAGRSLAGLAPPRAESFHGPVTLVADPVTTPFDVRADVRQGGRRLELRAADGAGGALSTALAGERVLVAGRIGPPPGDAPWLVPRHVAGRLQATSVDPLDAGSAPWRAANRLRRTIAAGAAVLDRPTRALYAGFVLGDDREQSPELVDDFRGAGLSHVLVVSGQNVAQVLVAAGPLLRRRRPWSRWAVAIVVIGSFALVTRFEPSVLRASAMAALAATATALGRPQAGLRILALAVGGLLLVDPLLIGSVGFQLSTAASAGILVLGPRIEPVLPGPEVLRAALSVTVAAQLGVAPVLVPRFGGIPVVSLPANVLAVPVAGLVTAWGLPAGLLAGWAGPSAARWLHLPTRLLVAWVAGVARVSARVPAGELGPVALVVLAGTALALVVAHRWWSADAARADHHLRATRLAAAVVVAVVLAAPAVRLASPPAHAVLPGGGDLWRAGGATVVVLGGERAPPVADLLEALRRQGVRRVDVVAATGGDEVPLALLAALRHRYRVGRVVGGDAPARAVAVGGIEVLVDAAGRVSVVSRGPDREGSGR